MLPPQLHWALVLAFGILTLGVFNWVWGIMQANFVKKLDEANEFMLVYIIASAALIAHVVSLVGAAFTEAFRGTPGSPGPVLVVIVAVSALLYPAYLVIYIMASLKMRRSISHLLQDRRADPLAVE